MRLFQRVLNGDAEQLGAGLNLQLLLDVGTVGFHGLNRDVKRFGDLANANALAQELEDLQLAIGQEIAGDEPVLGARPATRLRMAAETRSLR